MIDELANTKCEYRMNVLRSFMHCSSYHTFTITVSNFEARAIIVQSKYIESNFDYMSIKARIISIPNT